MYPERDQIISPFLYIKWILGWTLIYLKIHSTPNQWGLPGLDVYLLKILTTYVKLGHMHTIANITKLTILEYETQDIFNFFTSVGAIMHI